ADELYASQKMPGGIAPVAEPKPFYGLFPKSPKSAGRLVRADVRLARRDVQMLLTSLQGLVNRKRPRIYLDITQFPGEPSPDERWLAWLQERGDVQAVRTVDDPLTLLGEHRSEYRGLVVTDPAVPGTVNVATMIAGVENLLVASPELAAELDIPVIEDLRGRWTTNAEALDWAGEELWPKLNHHAFAVVHPDLPHLRDYLIAHRIYTFWVTGDIDGQPPAGSPVAEQIAVERVLAKAPVNVGCLGAPYNGVGIGFSEAPGVSMLSRYGKFLAWSNTNANLSVHSGTTPRQPLRHRPADVPELDPSKVYITMMVSDGDAPVNWYQFFPGIYWDDPAKGTFPLTWSMGPSVYDLMPDIMDYYYARANGGDGFVAACSGAGYCYPDAYGRQYADQDTVYEGYLDLTNRAMERLDLRGVWTHTATGQKLRDLAERVPMAEYLLPDYSRKPTTTAANANYAIGDVAVFHALTSFNVNLGADATMKLMIDDIRGYTPTERPGFMNVFVQCYPWTPSKLKQVLDALGPEYVPVRADHLGELYRRATQ
ncbi:MAG TPA: GxGYxYP family putative glycoside hydrolase, partial [Armatimonadota bacterium]|nr:GxGYxYP family putative glycoside hydrolase [Armatimonadota bacterium]